MFNNLSALRNNLMPIRIITYNCRPSTDALDHWCFSMATPPLAISAAVWLILHGCDTLLVILMEILESSSSGVVSSDQTQGWQKEDNFIVRPIKFLHCKGKIPPYIDRTMFFPNPAIWLDAKKQQCRPKKCLHCWKKPTHTDRTMFFPCVVCTYS